MTTIKFFVLGSWVGQHECESWPPSRRDMDKINEMKADLYHNFGYAVTTRIEHVPQRRCEDLQEVPSC